MERKESQDLIEAREEQLQRKVLSMLIFPESFSHIVEESGKEMSVPVIVSVIKDLMRDNKLCPIDAETGKKTFFYDSDRLNDYLYQATARGLEWLEKKHV